MGDVIWWFGLAHVVAYSAVGFPLLLHWSADLLISKYRPWRQAFTGWLRYEWNRRKAAGAETLFDE